MRSGTCGYVRRGRRPRLSSVHYRTNVLKIVMRGADKEDKVAA
jgi:hypothetical protein